MTIQFKRGTTDSTATYVGAVGEVTVDTDEKALVVHDGVTAGGSLMATVAALVAAFTSFLATVNLWSKGQAGAIVTLADAATVAVDLSLANNFKVTLAGNRTLGNPSNIVAGQSGIIAVTQDATGSRTLAFGAYWKFPGGVAPTLTTAVNSIDNIAYYVETTTRITAALVKDVK